MSLQTEYLWDSRAAPDAELVTLERALVPYRYHNRPLDPLRMVSRAGPLRRMAVPLVIALVTMLVVFALARSAN